MGSIVLTSLRRVCRSRHRHQEREDSQGEKIVSVWDNAMNVEGRGWRGNGG
jgi:hypothetical protein